MARVILKDVVKRFDTNEVVRNVNLTIEDKEFVVLVGPSGCGKTTTLRLVAGLEELTQGEIIIGDRVINDIPPKDRNISMVFQNYALYPHMTVYKNMAFGLKMRKVPPETIDQQVKHAASILGIQQLLDRKPKQLSGGERQRVAVGRAIVRDPEVFLFDEPLSNLDAKLRVQMRSELVKLHNRLEATMIYVTHDQVEAMTMGNRIVVMHEGVIHQVGTPLEVYNNPDNLFVATFIGSPAMNLLRGIFEVNGGNYRVNLGSFTLPVLPAQGRAAERFNGKEITLGVRPEHLYDVDLGQPLRSPSEPIECRVEVYEPLGANVILELQKGDHSLVGMLDPITQARAGQLARVRIDLERIHLFDPDDGTVVR